MPSHLAPPGLVVGVKLAQHADSAQLLKLGFVWDVFAELNAKRDQDEKRKKENDLLFLLDDTERPSVKTRGTY